MLPFSFSQVPFNFSETAVKETLAELVVRILVSQLQVEGGESGGGHVHGYSVGPLKPVVHEAARLGSLLGAQYPAKARSVFAQVYFTGPEQELTKAQDSVRAVMARRGPGEDPGLLAELPVTGGVFEQVRKSRGVGVSFDLAEEALLTAFLYGMVLGTLYPERVMAAAKAELDGRRGPPVALGDLPRQVGLATSPGDSQEYLALVRGLFVAYEREFGPLSEERS
ncbi:MAG: hypothetical protein HY683_10040 [Chloroflexi bacterium]|nr:hypothetical protein [Chloroflexota bacterium]